MEHSFDVELATKYGIKEAILLKHLAFWVQKNKANETHFQDGKYWTYNSVKAFEELFPYMSRNSISRSLTNLKEAGLIEDGTFNNQTYDRTKWYTLTELGEKSIYPNEEIHLPKIRNGFAQSQKPIPDINTDINTDKRVLSPSGRSGLSKQDVDTVLDAWNRMAKDTGLTAVSKLIPSSKRYQMLKERISEYDLEDVLKAIESIRQSGFLQGKNDRHWRIDFEWFVRPNNFPKVYEGRYIDGGADNDDDDDDGYWGEAIVAGWNDKRRR